MHPITSCRFDLNQAGPQASVAADPDQSARLQTEQSGPEGLSWGASSCGLRLESYGISRFCCFGFSCRRSSCFAGSSSSPPRYTIGRGLPQGRQRSRRRSFRTHCRKPAAQGCLEFRCHPFSVLRDGVEPCPWCARHIAKCDCPNGGAGHARALDVLDSPVVPPPPVRRLPWLRPCSVFFSSTRSRYG